ncbi:MAG: Trk system potassium transporter TrkA [Candidatus Omnitrophota bacterium]
MKIVIAGAGVIGSNLARELSEDHEVYLIESNPDMANAVAEKLDVKVVKGNGSSPDILTQTPVHTADLVIAVTTSDETNVVICALAGAYGAKHKVARVRNPSLERALEKFHGSHFNIDEIINPEEVAAEAIVKSVRTPGAREVADFAGGKILFRVFEVEDKSPLCGAALDSLNSEDYPWPFLIIAVMRSGEVFFARGDTVLQKEDRIYVLLPQHSAGEFLTFVDQDVRRMKRIIVCGATSIGERVAQKLAEEIPEILLLEENNQRADDVAGRLSNIRVIHGSGLEADILKECGVEKADGFIAATRTDHFNLAAAILAKKMGARNTIITTQAPDYMGIIDVVDIDTVINARFLAVDQILRYVHGQGVHALRSFAECDSQALELIPEEGAPITRKPLKELSFPKDALVGAVSRGEEVLLAHGDLHIQPGERVIVFCKESAAGKLKKLFSKRKTLF